MKKKLQLITIFMILPAFLVCCLGYVTLRQDKPNGFTRNIVPNYASLNKTYRSPLPIFYFAGASNSNYYFRTGTPEMILQISKGLNYNQVYYFKIESLAKTKQSFRMYVDSPDVYLMAGGLRGFMKAKLSSGSFTSTFQQNAPFFTDAIPCSSNGYITRTYDKQRHDMVFKKLNLKGEVIITENNISAVHRDEGASSQGTLLRSPDVPDRLYFIHRLSNTIVCFDTNLNLIYRSHSIDTISNPNLSLATTRQGRYKTAKIAQALRFTNYCAAATKENLFVHSRIKADNESTEQPVIDVYNAGNGKYRFSFHLPGNVSGINDLYIDGDTLTVIGSEGKQLLEYRIKNDLKNTLAKVQGTPTP